MANELLNAALWADNLGTSPAPEWNGTHYEVIASLSTYYGDWLHAINPITGSVGFTLEVVTPDTSDTTPVLEVVVNGSATWTQSLGVAGSFVYASGALSGATVLLRFVGGGVGPVYAGDYIITPTADPVISAPDETIIVAQNSAGNVIIPIITSSGSPVTPSSLTVLTQPANGTATVSGLSLIYTPKSGYYGPDSFTYKATVSGTDSNAATVSPSVLALACDELGRVTRSFVSGYTASRPEVRRVRRSSKRCVTANFNGALAVGRTITHVRWDCTSPWSMFMANPRVIAGQRQAAVDVTFNFAGFGGLLATVTLDNGETYNQEFFFTVTDSPLYPSAVYGTANGPFVLEIDA